MTTAEEIVDRTSDAYSFGRYYSRREWKRIVQFLRGFSSEDYSDDEVEEILRSKHMRWAADHVEKSRSVTLADFVSYYNFDGFRQTNKTYIREMLDDTR